MVNFKPFEDVVKLIRPFRNLVKQFAMPHSYCWHSRPGSSKQVKVNGLSNLTGPRIVETDVD